MEQFLELLEYVTHPTSIVKLPIHNVGLCHLALQVRDIKKAYKNLSNNDVEFISEPILSSGRYSNSMLLY